MRWYGWTKWGRLFLVVVGGLLSGSVVSQAATTNAVGFTVKAQLPKNQADQRHSFFDLNMAAGQQQTLKATISNITNRDIEVRMGINTAYTNGSGIIEYLTPAKSLDPSLKVAVSKVTKLVGAKTVTVPANGSKTVSAQVQLPNQELNGTLLGGWYFKRLNEKVTGSVKGSTNITNEYAYVIGIKYRLGHEPTPNLKLGDVQAGLVNYHRGILVDLRNPTATVIHDLTTDTTIKNRATGEVLKHVSKSQVKMAPNTLYRAPILTGSQRLRAGQYHLHLAAHNQAHRWTFDRDFEITDQAVKKYNRAAVDNRGISIWWLVGLGALAMLVLVMIVMWIFLVVRKRRRYAN